jgi:hypothetical protein
VFEDGVLTKIFGSKTDQVRRECRGLHNKELYDLYTSPNIIRVMKARTMIWARNVASIGDRSAYRDLVGKPERNRPLERHRRRWEDNIKTDLQDVGWGYGLD